MSHAVAILTGMVTRPAFVRASQVGFLLALALQTYLLYFFTSDGGDGELFPNADKVVHACMFGGPALLALAGRWRWAPLLLAVYAPISELVQGTEAVGRDGDWRDALADVSGIIVAVVLARWGRSRSMA